MNFSTKKACLIAVCDLCYNPRLLKIGDSLAQKGFSVTGVDIRVRMGTEGVYEKVFESRRWNINSLNIDKRTVYGWINWFIGALIQKLANGLCKLGFSSNVYYLYANLRYVKQLSQVVQSVKADVYICNQPVLLPIAIKAAISKGGIVWYDSQEYFRGMHKDKIFQKASVAFENKFIPQVSIVTTASRQIAIKLGEIYPQIKFFPLRNTANLIDIEVRQQSQTDFLKIIWHGFNVNLYGRGVNDIIKAMGYMKQPAILTLQGFVSESARKEILVEAAKYNIEDKIFFKKLVNPDDIITSLIDQDVGIAAEPGLDENQRLTSSNKIFEYLMAGLAIVASDMPGLIEVVNESKAGLIYPARNTMYLAEILDKLAQDRNYLWELQKNARKSAEQRMNWSVEIKPIIHHPYLTKPAEIHLRINDTTNNH